MRDVTSTSQLLRESKIQGNLRNHPMAAGLGLNGAQKSSGFMTGGAGSPIPALGQGGATTGFQDLVAIAQAQAELSTQNAMGGPVSQETARSLAQVRAMGMQNEMLSALTNLDQGGEGGARALVERMNVEALMSSGQFGNLRGHQRAPGVGVDTGRTFNADQMNSWRQKNGFLRPQAPMTAEEALAAEKKGVEMPSGLIRPPKRDRAEAALDLDDDSGFWIEDPLKMGSLDLPVTERTSPRRSESELLEAQKKDAAEAVSTSSFSREDLDRLVDKVSLALGMDPSLVKAVIKTESNFNPTAVSKVGAMGLMQLLPGTAKDLGVTDAFNPVENVWAGARYLKQMLDRHGGNINKALASYNWGPGNFDRHGSGKMPGETRRYITVVNQHYANFKKSTRA